MMPSGEGRAWKSVLVPAFLAGVMLSLFFWGLGKVYLWQDEAQTAILGQRLFQFGRPIAYDGTNLVTSDLFMLKDIALASQNSSNAAVAVSNCVAAGEFKPDSVWMRHPWGQFLFAGAGLKLFGHGTSGARLPFALAGFAMIILLYWWLARNFENPLVAPLGAVFLGLNSYWILYSRQCRYYSLSGLFLWATFAGYCRWQQGARFGATVFVAAAWCWFQIDFGTFWPVMGVLFLDALVRQRRVFWRPALVGLALAASIAPFVWFYELWNWAPTGARAWLPLLRNNLLNLNQYVVPVPLLLAAIVLILRRRQKLPAREQLLITVGCGVVAAITIWVPLTAPTAFLRYIAMAMPLGAMLAAWAVTRIVETKPAGFVWAVAALMVVTPVGALPFRLACLSRPARALDYVVRPELQKLASEIFGNRPDPNRAVVEWLKTNSTPADEILINYEDLPLVFYLPNPIRGGVAAFRVEDDAKSPPRFFVIRRSVPFVHWPIFAREIERYKWERIPIPAPDVTWGNNQDPSFDYQDPADAPPLTLARRIIAPPK